MEQKSAYETSLGELLNSFGNLLKQYEGEVNTFARAVDEHVKVLEKNPLLEALDGLLRGHEQRLREFGTGLRPGLERLDHELRETLDKQRELLANVEGRKNELAQAITGIATGLQKEEQLSLTEKAAVVDDMSDAVHSLARVVSEWLGAAKTCQDFLYTRLEKHEAFLESEEKLVASFTILLKMREELVHTRLEKHEAFLKSKEELLKSLEGLLDSYRRLLKEAITPGRPD